MLTTRTLNDSVENAPTIFLVEDNPADVYLIEQALKENGISCRLEVAENGGDAMSYLELLEGGADPLLPTLVLLDLNIPQKNGTELLKKIRLNDRLAPIRVVVLTSSDSRIDRAAATRLGADRYIRKPSSLQEFMAIGATLAELLNQTTSGL